MIPIYLMFANETEALAALTKDDAPIWPASALQWVPVPVTRVTGELDAEGFEISRPPRAITSMRSGMPL